MSVLYPLGLLALIGVPVIIIIYIIINKYTEQVISATYLWTLSERFLKRKNPLKSIAGIVSLILQLLIVAVIALSIAKPIFTLKGAAYDYIFILDGSGSMNISSESGETRLEEGKRKISSLVSASADGSTYTLIYSSDSTYTLCDAVTDKSRVSKLLDELEAGYCASDLTGAMSAAQERFNEDPSVKIYLITDKNYRDAGANFELVNLSSGEVNYALSDVAYEISGGELVVTGNVWSYSGDVTLNLSFSADGAEAVRAVSGLFVPALTATPFTFTDSAVSFSSFTVSIEENDGFALDSACTVYSYKSDSVYNTVIVSADNDTGTAFFIQAALTAFGEVQVTTKTASEYSASDSGYGLYIFNGVTPSALPSDGAVWFINPPSSLANTGFSVANTVSLEHHGVMSFSSSTSAKVQELLAGTPQHSIYLKNYVKISLNKYFYELLSYGGSPMLFAGTNSYGNREVVFAFGFADSDFVLCDDYIPLMSNLFRYTFPDIVSETLYSCGDTMKINVLANCTAIRVVSPSGGVSVLETSSDTAEYRLTEAGTYTVTLIIGKSTREVSVFACIPSEERYTEVTVDSDGAVYTSLNGEDVAVLGADGEAQETYFDISGTAEEGSRDGTYSELIFWFLALALIVIADWGLYCYEQYQLR